MPPERGYTESTEHKRLESRAERKMSLQARLVVVGGDVKTSEIKLRLPCTVGRGRGSAIVLAHPLVSRQHCEIYEVDGQLMVRDLGSLNGTFINNQRIGEAAPLPPNELLTIGTVTFRAVYDPSASSPESEEPSPKNGVADTVFAGRGPAGSGTVPLVPGIDVAATHPAEEQKPASQSSQEVLPPAAQLSAAAPKELMPPAAAPSPAADQPAAESEEEEADRSQTDDDLQVFLKSLGKNEKR
jgi:pSer/pThr/pTyr-binding forkhead associated (FHA) protein